MGLGRSATPSPVATSRRDVYVKLKILLFFFLVMSFSVVILARLRVPPPEESKKTELASQETNACPLEIMMQIVPEFEKCIESRCALLIAHLRFSCSWGKLTQDNRDQLLEEALLGREGLKNEISGLFRSVVGCKLEGMSRDEIIKELSSAYSSMDERNRRDVTEILAIERINRVPYELAIRKQMSAREREALAILGPYYKSIFLYEVSDFLKNQSKSNELIRVLGPFKKE